jgi:AcrR family transcriptional regulator
VAVARRILDRAPALIARGGKPTVADFARAAGVSRASFYRHFKSREALLKALDIAPEPDARERIVAAAVDLVGTRGLQALVMDDLADRAGVSRATLYRLFPGKPALLLAMVHAYSPLDAVTEVLTSRSQEPPEVLMPEIARTAYRAVAGRTGVMRAVLFEVSGLSPEIEEVAREALLKVVGLLVGYVNAQMAAGRLRREHPLLALQSFIGPVFFHILTRPIAEKVIDLDVDGESAVAQLAEVWLRAMSPTEERKR